MGCDIRGVVEVHHRGVWAPILFWDGPRDYEMYGRLVRHHPLSPKVENPYPCPVLPRGLPGDSLWICLSDRPGVGEHTHTWLTLSEFMEALLWGGDVPEPWRRLAIQIDVVTTVATTRAVVDCRQRGVPFDDLQARVVFGFID